MIRRWRSLAAPGQYVEGWQLRSSGRRNSPKAGVGTVPGLHSNDRSRNTRRVWGLNEGLFQSNFMRGARLAAICNDIDSKWRSS